MSRQDVRGLIVWSMWQRRMKPYDEIGVNDDVWIVERHGDRRWIGWQTVIKKPPLTVPYSTLREAAQSVEVRFGLPQGTMTGHAYTQSKRPYGHLLACELHPVRKVDIPLPAKLTLDRNGWTPLQGISDRTLRSMGLLE